MCDDDFPKIELLSTIGFEGKIIRGLQIHADKCNIITALGNTIVIRDICNNTQFFLNGHTNEVSSLAVSRSGKFLASGQITARENRAKMILWDFETRTICHCLETHTGKVDAMAFSVNDCLLASLGGKDDLNLFIYDVAKKEMIMGIRASSLIAGKMECLCFCSNVMNCLVTGGRGIVRVWKINQCQNKLEPILVPLKKNIRNVTAVEVDKMDDFVYCGTATGDILKIRLRLKVCEGLMCSADPVLLFVIQRWIPKELAKCEKPLFQNGITDLCLLQSGEMVVGAGDGTLSLCTEEMQTLYAYKNLPRKKEPDLVTNNILYYKEKKMTKLSGPVTSIAVRGAGHQFFIGTENCEIFRLNYLDWKPTLLFTSHCSAVKDIVFPAGSSEVFATCSYETIRVWNLIRASELLRITVPKWTCTCLDFSNDGRSIISGWSDGKIRSYTPLTGKEIFIIHNAHSLGVSVIGISNDCKKLVTGGVEGDVKVWLLGGNNTQHFIFNLKEHRGPITDLRIHPNDKACVTTSIDGTCIIWDLCNYNRSQVVFTTSALHCVSWGIEGLQVVMSGASHQLFYFESYNGNIIRELEASKCAPINGVDVSPDACFIVTGGVDKIIKLWRYEEGTVCYVGLGHSGKINRAKFSPDRHFIVSVSDDGAILVWKFPCFDLAPV